MLRLEPSDFSRLKLFVAFAGFMLFGLWALAHWSLREYRNFEFGRLERESTQWLTEIAARHSALVLAGEDEQLRLVGLNLLRRPELVYVRFDSPGSSKALVLGRKEMASRSPSQLAGEFDRSSSRIVRSGNTFVLQVVIPIRSVLPDTGSLADSHSGSSPLDLGSISAGTDVTANHAAMEDLANRIRRAQALIAGAMLLSAWIFLRRVQGSSPGRTESEQGRRAETASPDGRVSSTSDPDGQPRHASLPSQVEKPAPSAPIQPFEYPHRILVVEDNPVNRSVAVDMLEELGCSVACAENGEASVAAVDAETFDFIFMDIQMPGMDGLEATRRIRGEERRQGLTPVPIVALTAHSQHSDRIASSRAGMNDHISKPFTREDLAKAIRDWCEEKGNA
jgi:CheY-like chemotaxis protein